MIDAGLKDVIGPALLAALEKQGFTDLTPVQRAVLDPKVAGRDLRITSQTGSGKTVALGLALREFVESEARPAGPKALVIAPTRELAKQVKTELAWLYAGLSVAVVTGGSSYRDELRALSDHPVVVVGTPGRLTDHMERKSLHVEHVRAVVLDEADQMLDMGFRDALLEILGKLPEDRTTHLVSATFPVEVRSLADRVQRDPAHVQGTPLGTANADIDHVVHVVAPGDKLAAIINLLLANPGAQTLVFAKTRADVARLGADLAREGFHVSSLSGDMEQRERERALSAFKRGALHALVATDVAARGIDVQGIARVIHAEPPLDPDAYTHRSGRTGRAGKKGTSSVLVTPSGVNRAVALLRRARVEPRFEPIPSAEDIRRTADQRMLEDLLGPADEERAEPDDRAWDLAKRVFEHPEAKRALARLIFQSKLGPAEPRDVLAIAPPQARRAHEGPKAAPRRDRAPEPRGAEDGPRPARDAPGEFVTFRVTWGSEHGADPRRLLASVCRRGNIRGQDVGSIRLARNHSLVDVAAAVAEQFERDAGAPDPRDPRVRIVRVTGDETAHGSRHDRAKPARPFGARAEGEARPWKPKVEGEARPWKPKVEGEARPWKPKAEGEARPWKPKAEGEARPWKPKPEGEARPWKPKAEGEARPWKPKPEGEARPWKPKGKPAGEKPPWKKGPKPGFAKPPKR